MKRLKLERVLKAVESLRGVGLTRSGQWLPGFLCLRSHGLEVGNPVDIRGKDYVDFLRQHFMVANPPNPKAPFFDPLQSPPWKNENWPQGTFHSRNDRSLLIAEGFIQVSPQAPERRYKLKEGYEALFSKYFETDKRIPILDFAIWILRNEKLEDDVNARKLQNRLVKLMKLSREDLEALFEKSDANEELSELFTSVDWSISTLTPRLPPPEAASASAALEVDSEPAEETKVEVLDESTFVASLLAQLRDVENFEVTEEFLKSVLTAMRVDRFVILCGKPGTGKTEFVRALHRALDHVLRGNADVYFSHHEVHPETAEWELIGSRDLAGNYIPSPLMRDLTVRGAESDLHIVLLDEMNRGSVDSFAGRLLAAVSNSVPIDLPGRVIDPEFPASGKWEPSPGVILFAAINSPLTEPSRLPLSGPVKRRASLIPMPDPLEELAIANDEPAKKRFKDICNKRLMPQLQQRVLRRGIVPVFDGPLGDILRAGPSDTVLEVLWRVVVVLAGRVEVALTLGVLQGVMASVLISNSTNELASLDQALMSKIVPHLRGDVSLINKFGEALGEGLPLTQLAIDRARQFATENGDQVNPMY
jgi:MoxR-like ATPase